MFLLDTRNILFDILKILEKLVQQVFDKGDSVVIVGDFNLWVDEKGDTDSGKVLS